MASTLSEACEAAYEESLTLELNDTIARHYVINERHIGTGATVFEDTGAEHCIFEFSEEPESVAFHSLVAAHAYRLGINIDSDDFMKRLKEAVYGEEDDDDGSEEGDSDEGSSEEESSDDSDDGDDEDPVIEELRAILRNVEYLACQCETEETGFEDE